MAVNVGPVFKANLEQLPEVGGIARIVLKTKTSGEDAGTIENKPGTGGSVRLYAYLLSLFGGEITRQAAYMGCALFAEHTEDAHKNPGNHGNIDRLLKVIQTGESLIATVENA
mmetsp:Transcript_9306/g.18038  ORF Transcript_9306/g.18038 Transcript_9306/m.18038 type:complete len:113 (+) Transcript_9306:60-398(+)|eukprot:CAMPEP_0173377534 /NCGR_PEP_ID=MMETSP1356-20130122/783_1 /TAXON_ID=77927 ORGANISM="Hemiselmis virescens, Strain PCC157" /NCGR_SAMPLE_ID=MMETSP1356 /ASSEMBLY_ACC=CAM_ASM_000847 /LENGTH=112 /DNA_ID=CAMNT_0014330315 /DNA_START=61 /DNA_END=399 /DNA_ORIENTATION=+